MRDENEPTRLCCSLARNQVRYSFAALGCGASLKMPPVSVNIGVSSTGDHTISNFPSRLNGQTDEEASKVAMFSPEATLRATGRWPWMKVGFVAMYLSIQPQPYFCTMR